MLFSRRAVTLRGNERDTVGTLERPLIRTTSRARRDLRADPVVDALDAARRTRGNLHGAILHTDSAPGGIQGNEFCVIGPPEGSYDQRRLVAEEAGLRQR